MLNRARNYADYTEAIVNLKNPGQNCAFAAKNGDIAIRTQGDWPAKWAGQGDFIMPGTSDKYLIQGYIPQSEVPFQYNPERGFVSSANQKPVDDQTYPYYLGRNYPLYRGIRINKNLNKMNGITVQDMMNLQNDNLNEFAVYAMPMVLKHLNPQKLSTEQKTYYELLKNWDLKNTPDSKGATIFELFWDELDGLIYNDEYKKAPGVHLKPYMSTLLEALLRDESYSFVDDIETPGVETLANRMNEAFKNISDKLFKLEKKGKLEWGRYRGTDIKHLSKLEPFSIVDLKTGGHSNCINATKYNHGPSWKMIVSLTEQTEAYGIFPGGQDGNPGSPYYSNYIEKWTKGEYYRLWVMDRTDTQNKAIVWSVKLNGDRQ